MKTKAVRLYGKQDLRLETFTLPPIREDEILAKVISDSLCMSSYKAAVQGSAHKRVPEDIAVNPVIIGHEFCGELVEVGAKWADRFQPGDRFAIQPAFGLDGRLEAPGYSYRYVGGNATYVIIPPEAMETDSLLSYHGDAFFYGSLAEPMSCVIGGAHANYHTTYGSYVHHMGIKAGGKAGLFAGAGPMGMGLIDYLVHNEDRHPALLVVTDIDDARLRRAESLFTPQDAARHGVTLLYVNTQNHDDADACLRGLTGGTGFDDIFVYAPVRPVVEMADRLLGADGCLNFFAGPTDPFFSASFNFYNVHYASIHITGTSGGNTDDMRESIALMEKGIINPVAMITHVGGLDSVVEATLNLPNIPGGKKLIYTQKSMPLTAIEDFVALGEQDAFFAALVDICARHNGLWSSEAERYLLEHALDI